MGIFPCIVSSPGECETLICNFPSSTHQNALKQHILKSHLCIRFAGVRSQYRRQGVGRCLMSQLFGHVATLPTCQLVYLHVLSTNTQALGQWFADTSSLNIKFFYLFCFSPKWPDHFILYVM